MRDFHAQPFDRGTDQKLELFRLYIREWLPVFLSQPWAKGRTKIFDFFAGPGRDLSGAPGTPMIILEELRAFHHSSSRAHHSVHLVFNERNEAKAAKLRELLVAEQLDRRICTWTVESMDFPESFSRWSEHIKRGPCLLLLDQQGIKHGSEEIFRSLIALPRTDVLLFVASQVLRRFSSHPSVRSYLALDEDAVQQSRTQDIHRLVAAHYKGLAKAEGSKVLVGSFSIKKGANIYGVLFLSQHPLGLSKFIGLCWKIDSNRGEANFDIDEERIDPARPSLFAELDRPSKLRLFEEDLKKAVLAGALTSDAEVFIFTIERGVLPRQGRQMLGKILREANAVSVISKLRVSMDGFKDPRPIRLNSDG